MRCALQVWRPHCGITSRLVPSQETAEGFVGMRTAAHLDGTGTLIFPCEMIKEILQIGNQKHKYIKYHR